MTTPTNQELCDWLEERAQRFTAISDAIWREPQVALQETAACAVQIADLRAEGFRIQEHVGGMPTAFVAEWGAGSPIIGFVVETRGTDFASLAYPDAQEVGLKVVTLDDSTLT